MTTTLSRQHLERLAAVESLEAGVCRAGLAWCPAGQKASAAKAQMIQAEQRLDAAKVEFDAALRNVTSRDHVLGDELRRRHIAGKLNRESVGADNVPLINAVLVSAETLRKSREAAASAQATSSSAQAESASAWRDVLRAFDQLRSASSADVAAAVATLFGSTGGRSLSHVPPTPNPDAVGDACKTRLKVLAVKA